MHLLSIILSLPTANATARQRTWRALKASGAAVLRDGVYLMPEFDTCHATLEAIATDVQRGGGTAYVVRIEEPEGANFFALFDRSEEYTMLLADVAQAREALTSETALATLKQTCKLRKVFTNLAEIDFFPGEAHKQTDAALQDLELAAARVLSPDEPHPVEGAIACLQLSDYRGRTWATRRRPWVDRLACAWLIRRFIDPQARLLWLASPADCPADALGFDFDGAAFTHVGARVSFEVLVASFGLAENRALARLGMLVHYLDVGGVPVAEAVGVEAMLTGLRSSETDDDKLFDKASNVFDWLIQHYKEKHGD